MYLTLSGGTSDQATAANPQCIVRAQRKTTTGSESRNYGGAIRGCRIALDKSHGANVEYFGGINLQCARQFLIENNFFNDCLSAIVLNSYVGSQTDTLIRYNEFGGDPDLRACEIDIWINSDDCNSIVIRDNCFADGLPNHTGGLRRFINMPITYTAGTGIIANNYFSTKTNIGSTGWETTGTQCRVADTMFGCHNFGESITTVSGEMSIGS